MLYYLELSESHSTDGAIPTYKFGDRPDAAIAVLRRRQEQRILCPLRRAKQNRRSRPIEGSLGRALSGEPHGGIGLPQMQQRLFTR
jgi:hypothetical protein